LNLCRSMGGVAVLLLPSRIRQYYKHTVKSMVYFRWDSKNSELKPCIVDEILAFSGATKNLQNLDKYYHYCTDKSKNVYEPEKEHGILYAAIFEKAPPVKRLRVIFGINLKKQNIFIFIKRLKMEL